MVQPRRYDLDACDIQEKYPDLFQVSLEVEVEPRDRPCREAPPWESTSMRGLNPKILFSSREEQQDVLSKFGESWGSTGASPLPGSGSRHRAPFRPAWPARLPARQSLFLATLLREGASPPYRRAVQEGAQAVRPPGGCALPDPVPAGAVCGLLT